MGSVEKQREILEELCNRIKEENVPLQGSAVSPDNAFSVFGVIRKEVPYCRVLLYLIQNNWQSFEKTVLNGCCGGQTLKQFENEFACEAPCPKYDKEGRIDIFLRTDNHIVAIEAKVDAGNQEHQLARYQKYLNDMSSGQKNIKIHIIYLTMTGYEPDEYTRVCQKCNNNCEAGNVTSISWENDIYNWIETIVTETIVGPGQNNSIAEQFLEVLQMERNNPMSKHINILSESQEYLEIVDSLKRALPEFWKRIRQTFFERLADLLKEEYCFEIQNKEANPFKNEVWAITLNKNGMPLYICYERNLFLRTGEAYSEWEYIDRNSFTENGPASTSRNQQTAVYMLDFRFDNAKGCNRDLINWYYHRDDIVGQQILARIAESANSFFEKHLTK